MEQLKTCAGNIWQHVLHVLNIMCICIFELSVNTYTHICFQTQIPGHCEFSSFADCILFLFPEGRCVFLGVRGISERSFGKTMWAEAVEIGKF